MIIVTFWKEWYFFGINVVTMKLHRWHYDDDIFMQDIIKIKTILQGRITARKTLQKCSLKYPNRSSESRLNLSRTLAVVQQLMEGQSQQRHAVNAN